MGRLSGFFCLQSGVFKARNLRAALLISLGFLLMSCTREVPKVSTKVSIDVSKIIDQHRKVGAASTKTVNYVALNVSGPGVPLIRTWWSAHGPNGVEKVWAKELPPVEVPTEVPLLFQVLLVQEDSTDGSYAFYYGDLAKTVKSGETEVTVFLDDTNNDGTPDPISAPGVSDGQIAGRLLTAPTSGPTGQIRIMYTPPRGPKMEVEKSPIVNGWFSVFGLTGLQFNYLLDDGTELFGAPKKVDDWTAGSNQIAIVYRPSYYWSDGDPMSATSRNLSAASRIVMGWFVQETPVKGKQLANVIEHPLHKFANNDTVQFASITGGAGLTAGPTYYVRNPVPGSYQLASSSGGTPIDFTTDITAAVIKPVISTISSKAVCYSTVDANLNYVYDSANTSLTTTRAWNWDDTTTNTAHILSGGVGTSNLDANGLCLPASAPNTPYDDLLQISEQRLTSNDSFSGFRAPFKPYSMDYGWPTYLKVDYKSGLNTLYVKWKFLPQVFAVAGANPVRGVDGVDVYMRILSDQSGLDYTAENYKDSDDRPRCEVLSSFGFLPIATDSTLTVDDGIDYVVPATGAFGSFVDAMSEGRVQIIACPFGTTGFSSKTYLTGIEYQNYSGFNGGYQLAEELEIILPSGSDTGNIANQSCTPFYVQGKKNGAPAYFDGSTTLYFSEAYSSGSGDITIHRFSDCSDSDLSAGAQLYGGDLQRFYMNKPTTGAAVATVTVQDHISTPTLEVTSGNITFADIPGSPTYILKARLSPGAFRSYKCVPLTMELWDSVTNMMVPNQTAGSIVFTTSSASTGFKVYNEHDWACAGTGSATGTFDFAVGSSYMTKNIQLNALNVTSLVVNVAKASGTFTGSVGSVGINLTSVNGATAGSGTLTIPVTNPKEFHHLALGMPMYVPQNSCMSVDLRFEDLQGNLTPYMAGNVVVNLTAGTGGSFYTGQSYDLMLSTPHNGANLDVSGSGQYFMLSGGTDVVWFKVTDGSNTQVEPFIPGPITYHRVDILSADSDTQVATKLKNVVDLITGFDATVSGTNVTVVASSLKSHPQAWGGTANVGVGAMDCANALTDTALPVGQDVTFTPGMTRMQLYYKNTSTPGTSTSVQSKTSNLTKSRESGSMQINVN